MDKFPTPTLDLIQKKKINGEWKALDGESIDPTSLDDKMRDILLLGTLELIGSVLVEIQNSLKQQVKKDIPPAKPTVEVSAPQKPISPQKKSTTRKG